MMHRTTYDEWHTPVDFQRIFGLMDDEIANLDYTTTLLNVRETVIRIVWTDVLDDIFDSILWEEENEAGFLNRFPEVEEMIEHPHNHGYRALKMLAGRGDIEPIYHD